MRAARATWRYNPPKLGESDKVGEVGVKDAPDAPTKNSLEGSKAGAGQKTAEAGKSMTSNNSELPLKDEGIPPLPVGLKDFPAQLSAKQRAFLYVPGRMSQKEYDLLKKQLESHLAVIEATLIGEDKPQSNQSIPLPDADA